MNKCLRLEQDRRPGLLTEDEVDLLKDRKSVGTPHMGYISCM